MSAPTRARVAFALAVLLAACLSAPPAAFADEPQVGQLTDRYDSLDALSASKNSDENVVVDTRVGVLTSVNRALDGMPVRFSGEAVGDIIDAGGGYKWVNVLGSGGSAIGVYMTDEQAALVANLGSYHKSGSTIEVQGTYSVACPKHQGELDVHATDVRVTDAGGDITHEPNTTLFSAGIALSALGFSLMVAFIVLRRRSEAKK